MGKNESKQFLYVHHVSLVSPVGHAKMGTPTHFLKFTDLGFDGSL